MQSQVGRGVPPALAGQVGPKRKDTRGGIATAPRGCREGFHGSSASQNRAAGYRVGKGKNYLLRAVRKIFWWRNKTASVYGIFGFWRCKFVKRISDFKHYSGRSIGKIHPAKRMSAEGIGRFL